ncbi:MAG TPA: DivIVA domain-containing protein [Solirubrobacteraceae bacterium]|nr:DivIVA domain-containing protein [Solirubrobacteraceae bacterium]
MALDRNSIQRKDFSVSRRGYDPAEVDAHLSAVADEVATAQAQPRGGESLASSASDHVRTIIEAAEGSAAQIRREAEEDAIQTRRRAEEDARKVSASSAEVLEQLEAARRQLDSVIESLRADGPAGKNGRGLGPEASAAAAVEHSVPAAEPAVRHAPPPAELVAERAVPGAQPIAQHAAAAADDTAAAADDTAETTAADDVTAARNVAPGDAAEPSEPAAPASGRASSDAEGARLIALHMALNGTPRDETAKYLSENYELSDRERLLDDVYASVER